MVYSVRTTGHFQKNETGACGQNAYDNRSADYVIDALHRDDHVAELGGDKALRAL